MLLRSMIWFTLCSLVLACGGGGSSSDNLSPQSNTTPYNSENISLQSRNMQDDYPLTVMLPGNYTATQDVLPLILVLDGVWHLNNVVNVVETNGTRAVIVGIGNNQRREPDFVPPQFNGSFPELQDGNADRYMAMLRDEMIPLLEQRYRIDSTRRYLIGHSLGGLLVEYALLTDNPDSPLFHGYLAADASNFNYEYLANLETLFYQQTKTLPVQLFVGSADNGIGQRAQYVGRLIEAHHYQSLQLNIRNYATDHGGIMSVALPDAIQFFFPPSAASSQ